MVHGFMLIVAGNTICRHALQIAKETCNKGEEKIGPGTSNYLKNTKEEKKWTSNYLNNTKEEKNGLGTSNYLKTKSELYIPSFCDFGNSVIHGQGIS